MRMTKLRAVRKHNDTDSSHDDVRYGSASVGNTAAENTGMNGVLL